MNSADQLEEERRLLFVGITRAKEELQLSYTERRNYRGRELMPIPSSFLMELPRAEMTIITTSGFAPRSRRPASDFDDDAGDAFEGDAEVSQVGEWDDFDFVQDEPPAKQRSAKVMTAAEMFTEGETAARQIPSSAFVQGMIVSHPEYGDGQIIALSGSAHSRTAVVRFYGSAGEKRFRLAQSKLTPANIE